MTDFLTDKRNEIKARLDELRPLVEEAGRLEAALAALDGAANSPAATATRKRRSTTAAAGSKARRGRPRGSGKRAQEALALINKRPGISISEMAETMGIHQNYLYRVVPGLQADGKVRKDGRGWYPAG